MMSFIRSDPTLAVGDFVLSSYHKGELVFKVTKITPRFLTAADLRYEVYKGAKVGDEYTPLVTIESVANLSINADPNKKFRKTTKSLDAWWVRKISVETLEKHMRRLSNIIHDLWP